MGSDTDPDYVSQDLNPKGMHLIICEVIAFWKLNAAAKIYLINLSIILH